MGDRASQWLTQRDESEIESITKSEEEPFSDNKFVKIGMLSLLLDFSNLQTCKPFYLCNLKHA